MSQIWKVGAQSISLGSGPDSPFTAEYIHVDEEYPAGRYTTDQAQAQRWAEELCAKINADPNSEATDYTPYIWPAELPVTD